MREQLRPSYLVAATSESSLGVTLAFCSTPRQDPGMAAASRAPRISSKLGLREGFWAQQEVMSSRSSGDTPPEGRGGRPPASMVSMICRVSKCVSRSCSQGSIHEDKPIREKLCSCLHTNDTLLDKAFQSLQMDHLLGKCRDP